MKLLLDECMPVDLRHELAPHDVITVTYMKWKGLKNGHLLSTASAAGSDALITNDKRMADEQNPSTLPIAIVVVHTGSTLAELLPMVPKLLTALNHLQPKAISHVYP